MRLENPRGDDHQNGHQNRHTNAPLSEINIIPLVDVMLVLLIIFMITTVFTKDTGLKLDLPPAKSSEANAQTSDDLVVALGQGNQITLEGEPASEAQIAAAMRARLQKNPKTRLVIKGDGRVAYERIVRVMDLARQAGLTSVALGTRPPDTEAGGNQTQ